MDNGTRSDNGEREVVDIATAEKDDPICRTVQRGEWTRIRLLEEVDLLKRPIAYFTYRELGEL